MVEGANFQQLKEMLTIVYPDPNGNINIQGDNLKKLMTQMGFEFVVSEEAELNQLRQDLDANATGTVKIDDFARHLEEFVNAMTDENALVEAFKQFDADNDNKLSMEEFEFFMTGFAKECNSLMDGKMVAHMLDLIYREKLASEAEPSFDISEMVTKMKSVWAA